MRFGFWHKADVQHGLPPNVRQEVEQRLGPQGSPAAGLRCRTERTNFAGRTVTAIRVFDPALVRDGDGAVGTYDDLARHADAVLFEGHIDQDGSVWLLDVRPGASRSVDAAQATK